MLTTELKPSRIIHVYELSSRKITTEVMKLSIEDGEWPITLFHNPLGSRRNRQRRWENVTENQVRKTKLNN